MKDKIKKFFESELGQKIKTGLITLLRNAVLLAAGYIVEGLIELVSGLNLNPLLGAYITGGLKIIDELLHKTGIATKGLTRF